MAKHTKTAKLRNDFNVITMSYPTAHPKQAVSKRKSFLLQSSVGHCTLKLQYVLMLLATTTYHKIIVVKQSIFVNTVKSDMYGPKCENGEWKSRTNREIEEMSKGENIVKWIKGQRISWLGHLERMEENRMTKKIFT